MEILIALAVFAILATITSSTLYYAFNTRSRVTAQADRLFSLQMALTLLERDTEQVVNRSIRGNELHFFPAFIGRSDYMEFTRSGIPNPNYAEKRSTMKRLALLCQNNQLIRRTWPTLDTPKRDNYEDRILLKGLSKCQFAYLNETLQVLPEWHATDLSQGNKKAQLPKAVQVNLTLTDWGSAVLLYIIPESLYEKT